MRLLIVAFLSSAPMALLASDCNGLDTCSACVQHNALTLAATKCWYCPLDDEGNRCHDIGAVLTSNCYGVISNSDCIAAPTTSSTCPMKSPDFCPEAVPQIRVTKGMMSRPYGSVRVSLISPTETLDKVSGFDYNKQFEWKWQQLALSSSLLQVPASQLASGAPLAVPFTWMHGSANATLSLPKQGEGTVGLMIADPCVGIGLGATPGYCAAASRFHTADRIPEMTNAMLADGSIQYWATLGDNWYDPKGDISQTVYSRYSQKVLEAINVVIPGNHDYWSFGPTLWPSPFGEQCGNGFMQFNAMDTMAAKGVSNGSAAAPFDFSVDPATGITKGADCAAKHTNMNFYQQIGNVAIIGYTGAASYDELAPFFGEACAAVGAEPSVQAVFLVSHWDDASGVTGGHADSTTPEAFSRVMRLDGCKEFHAKSMFKWVTGHTHCNTIAPYLAKYGDEVASAGFRVSGMGMAASEDTCRVAANGTHDPSHAAEPNFGFPIFDSTNGRLRILYFDTNDDAKYAAALACVQQNGWHGCEDEPYVSTWLDMSIAERD